MRRLIAVHEVKAIRRKAVPWAFGAIWPDHAHIGAGGCAKPEVAPAHLARRVAAPHGEFAELDFVGYPHFEPAAHGVLIGAGLVGP